jgi:hypothetical protein
LYPLAVSSRAASFKPLARVKIEDVDRIVDAIHHRRVKPPLGTAARPAASHGGCEPTRRARLRHAVVGFTSPLPSLASMAVSPLLDPHRSLIRVRCSSVSPRTTTVQKDLGRWPAGL